jgi:predicted MFS family arabinose efflux permease
MKKRVTVFLMVAVMLFTFCIAPPANAIVPAVAWVIWGIVAGGTGVAVVVDQTSSDHEQAQANNQRQEEPKGTEDNALASQQSPD